MSLPKNALHIRDTATKIKYLVDTGACCSLFPATYQQQQHPDPDPISLTAAGGQIIRTHGTINKTIHIAGYPYEWQFRLADVTQPLLGADFLIYHRLVVDMAGKAVIPIADLRCPNPTRSTRIMGQVASCINTHSDSVCSSSVADYTSLKQQFSDIFRPELKLKDTTTAKHDIVHHIQTTGPPQHARYRRLSPKKLSAAKAAFKEMESMGVCHKAPSPWSSPLHMVKKADGSWRPCGDYRRLNNVTVNDKYPMPNVSDMTNVVGNSSVFSKLDLLKAYFQVPVNPEDQEKTAICTPFGSFVFRYSTFGLKNAGATFQRLMDVIFGECSNVIVYVDDILVFSNNHKEHLEHLKQVFELCRKNGLILHVNKCTLGADQVEFLGHNVSKRGITPLPAKIQGIVDYSPPTTIKALQRFLGMINYFRRFVRNHAQIVEPLTSCLKSKDLVWGPKQQCAFETIKQSLANATHLQYPLPEDKLILSTDASKVAIGAILEAKTANSDTPRPISFFSRTLSDTERRYSTFDRELLAVHNAVRHFRHLIDGSECTILTDHKPLTTALLKSGEPWTDRQRGQLAEIAESGAQLMYTKGADNTVADALSRTIIGAISDPDPVPGISYNRMAMLQRLDPETTQYQTAVTGLKWQQVDFGQDSSLWCDVSTGRPRPLVPKLMREQVMQAIHNLSHPSISTTVRLVSNKFVWHGVKRDVRAWARNCLQCQKNKITKHVHAPLGQFEEPTRRFQHVHIDVTGPLPESRGMRYIFTAVDRSTRWSEAIPMPDQTTSSCAFAFISGWLSRFGVPQHITSDQGAAFTSSLWSYVTRLLGIEHHQTTSYHPAANGMVERFHRDLKVSLRSRCTNSSWMDQLPWVLLGLRTSIKQPIGTSSAEMVYGQPLCVPGEFWPTPVTDDHNRELQQARAAAEAFIPSTPSTHGNNPNYIPADLKKCDYVFLRDDRIKPTLCPPYTGPYEVIRRLRNTFLLQMGSRQKWQSINRLKPAYTASST